MKKLIFILINVVLINRIYAQMDTIYSNDNVLIVQVKEILPEAVKFSYPNESLINTMYKNSIQKIVYNSGRTEIFAESLSLKKVKGAEDWQNVAIAMVESEVKGLYKIDEVSSKAKGATALSNMDKVKDRSYKKLKIEAALMGANLIYLTNENVKGNVFGTEYQAAQPTETILSGIAYSNTKPEIENFKLLVSKNNKFRLLKKQWIGRNSTDLQQSPETLPVFALFTDITEENGFIYVCAIVNGEKDKFRLTYFDENKILLMYKDKNRIYNLVLGI